MKFLIGYEVPSVRGTDEWKDRISRAHKGTVDARKLQAFAEASRRWRERHPEAARQVMRTSRQRRRLRAMTIVGRGVIKCDRCGVDDPRILEINHLNGGGRAERRASEHDQNLYGPILRGERDLDDLNLLCRPCNAIDEIERKFPDLRGRLSVMVT